MDPLALNQLACLGDHGPLIRHEARWSHSSPLQLANARKDKSLKAVKSKLAAAEKKTQTQDSTLQAAIAVIPGAGQFLGITRGQASQVGRMKNIEPGHFVLLCRVLTCPGIAQIKLGVKRTRLLLAARLVLLHRQATGLTILLNNSLANRIAHRDRKALSVDIGYSHEWDETDSTFRSFGNDRLIAGRMGVHVQTIQQRGQVTTTIASETMNKLLTWREEWLMPALVVAGTKACDLLPAILRYFPKEFLLTGPIATLKSTLASVDSFVFAPCCDAASANISILKFWGWLVESLREAVGPRLLFLPDTCQVHSHQRGKASTKGVKVHLSRHFSMSKLLRREAILAAIGRSMKQSIYDRVYRKFEPPPEVHRSRFFKALDLLYNLSNQKLDDKGLPPQFIQDLRQLTEIVNDQVDSEHWWHYCWQGEDGEAPGQPCCNSEDHCRSKTMMIASKCLYSRAEQSPGEGKWTYLLSSFKRTLLRKLVHGVGIITSPALEGGAQSSSGL
jgi:hypothetical protein